MTPSDQSEFLGFMEEMGGLSKVGASLSLAQRISNLVARQYHGFTGMLPGESTMSAAKKLEELTRLGIGEKGALRELEKARETGKGVSAAQARLEAAKEKLETLPGVLKGLVTKPGKTLSIGWRSHTPAGKFVIGTAPILPIYGAVTKKDLQPGETVSGRVAEEAGRTLGYGATGGLPLIPSLAAGMGAGKAGKILVESLRGE